MSRPTLVLEIRLIRLSNYFVEKLGSAKLWEQEAIARLAWTYVLVKLARANKMHMICCRTLGLRSFGFKWMVWNSWLPFKFHHQKTWYIWVVIYFNLVDQFRQTQSKREWTWQFYLLKHISKQENIPNLCQNRLKPETYQPFQDGTSMSNWAPWSAKLNGGLADFDQLQARATHDLECQDGWFFPSCGLAMFFLCGHQPCHKPALSLCSARRL